MIAISKSEKDVICKRFPTVHIVRTMRQKSKRHRYFCEESRAVLSYLKEARSKGVVTYTGKGDGYTTGKTGKRV